MIITFADRKLKKYANNNSIAQKKMGAKRAKLFQRRLADMDAAVSFADFEHLPGNFHQLRSDRKDEWACDLDQPYRLVFKPAEVPIPKDDDGKQILIKIKSLKVIEVTNYHKKK